MSKAPKLSEASAALVPLFEAIGLPSSKATEAAKNPKSGNILKTLIERNDLTARQLDDKQASLFAAMSAQLAKTGELGLEKETFVVHQILEGKLKSVDQTNGGTYPICTTDSLYPPRGCQIRGISSVSLL